MTVRHLNCGVRRSFFRRAVVEHRCRCHREIEGRRLHGGVRLQIDGAIVFGILEGDATLVLVMIAIVAREVGMNRRSMMVLLVDVGVKEGRTERPHWHCHGEEPRNRSAEDALHSLVEFYSLWSERHMQGKARRAWNRGVEMDVFHWLWFVLQARLEVIVDV